MNYFITGGTGFIGTHLTNLLQELHPECNVYNLDIVEPGTPLPSVEDYKPALRKGQKLASTFIRCDVRKPIVLEGVNVTADDVIFNFAAVHRTPGHPDYAYFETNVLGAENVTAFAEKYGIKKIVFTSSIAPYGAAEELKEETTVPTPNTPYGISKLVAEKIHEKWAAVNNAQLVIVRPGVVYGKGEHGNMTRLYSGISKHYFFYTRKDTVKACIYVKVLVRFFLWSLENGKTGVWNCTFEPAYSIEQICETMKKATKMKRFIPVVPGKFLMGVAAIIGPIGGKAVGIHPARVRKLMVSTNISGDKLKTNGYKFHWTLEESFADWFEDCGRKYLK